MKHIQHFWVENGQLKKLDVTDKLLGINWQKNETLKVEVWPFDLKAGPFTNLPYEPSRNKKKEYVEEILANTAEYRRAKEERQYQTPVIRVDQTCTPYSEESTAYNESRGWPDIPKEVPERRSDSE